MDTGALIQVGGTIAASGLIIHLLDRWRYRRKPALDVAQLAQQVAAEALEHVRAELAAERADNAKLRAELDDLREQLAAARVEISRLTALLAAQTV